MAGDRYSIQDKYATYFLTITIVNWTALLIRRRYKDIIVNSLNFCIANKGLILNAWVIMTNHIHLVGRVESGNGMSGFLRDFKQYTSRRLVRSVMFEEESRKESLLKQFAREAGRSKRVKYFKVWKNGNHAMDLTNNNIDVFQKIDYVHMNPVVDGWVEDPEDYLYSSAKNYAGKRGLIEVEQL